jgi:hypothetical protein
MPIRCAVCAFRPCSAAGEEDSWHLEPYQVRKGQAATFVEQMRFGVREAAANQASLLLFSGGKTRPGSCFRIKALGLRLCDLGCRI